MEENEIWKTVENYENYEVSSLGKVRNVVTNKMLKPSNKAGYYHVSLTNKNLKKTLKFIV